MSKYNVGQNVKVEFRDVKFSGEVLNVFTSDGWTYYTVKSETSVYYFDGESGKYLNCHVYVTTWPEYCLSLQGAKVVLNKEYDALVSKDSIQVGGQVIPWGAIEQVIEAHKQLVS